MRVNFFAETKTNIGNLPLSRWKTIEISKIVRFQSLNFISEPKGCLLRPTKLWEKLIVLKRTKVKSDEAKGRRKLFKHEKGKVRWNDIPFFFYLTSQHSILLLYISIKWSLNCAVYRLYKIMCSSSCRVKYAYVFSMWLNILINNVS